MKSFDGYLKKKFGDSYALLAGGGEKSLNDFMLVSQYYYPSNMPNENEPSSSYFGTDSRYNYVNSFFSHGWPNSWEYADILNWTGYQLYGGTQLAVEYCKDTPRVALRTWYYPQSRWGNWVNIITSTNISLLRVASLTTTSKSAFGLTYWNASGQPIDIPITAVGIMRYLYFRNKDDNGYAGYVGRGVDSSNEIHLLAYSGNALDLGANNGVGHIHIKTNSYVGIGTTDPSCKLDVNGLLGINSNGCHAYIGAANTSFFHINTVDRNIYIHPNVYVDGYLSSYNNGVNDLGLSSKYWNHLYCVYVNGNNTFVHSGNISNLDVRSAQYLTSPYKYTGLSTYNVDGQSITDSMSSESLCRNYNGTVLVAFHKTDWGWSDTLYFTGYDRWGGTELATLFNVGSNVRVKIRKFYLGTNTWGSWTEFITNGNITNYYWANQTIGTSASYLTTPTVCYLLFRNTANNGSAGYVGRGSSSSNEIYLCGYSGAAVNIGANNGSGHIYVNTSGNVGIGTTSISYKLQVNGNIASTNFYTTSDRSKKHNISLFSEHIRKFQLKDTEEWHYGVIAQEVEEIFRQGEEGNMTVNYHSILSFYIGQLENKVKELEEKVRYLENLNK